MSRGMTGRELRLLAVAGAGLALVLLARAGGEAQPSVTVEGMEEEADVAVVAGSAGGTTAPLAPHADLSDQLLELAGDQGIHFIDFDEVAQLPDLCDEGVDAETLASLPAIEMSDGVSEVLDALNVSHLEVLGESFGDLTGDGRDEAAVHSVCRYGASGRQHEVQVWQSSDGVPTPAAVVPAPETDGPFPPDVSSVAIDDGVLEVTWAEYAEEDAYCCPSGETTLTYVLDGNEVVPAG
jgi:hypothetical protein